MAGIYIHIPFCKKACHYCNFHFSTSLKYKTELLDAIKKEIILQKEYVADDLIETVYFGGGTPSVLNAGEIESLIGEIYQNYTLSNNPEITLEANPDDLDEAKIREIRQSPVNRFSIGIQSFFEEDLKWMNRAHTASEAGKALKLVLDAGFENITADLIYGYPLLSDAKWERNIQQLLNLPIPHISAYAMTVEPATALASFIKKGKQTAMDEEQSARQFIFLADKLESEGFEHYEISNFAKPGWHSRHNSNYWNGISYIGIGPSAHSFNGTSRKWNIANNTSYRQSLEKGIIPSETEILSEKDRFNEYVLISIRTRKGMDLNRVEKGFGQEFRKGIERPLHSFISKGWIAQDQNIVRLTRQGMLFADHISAELMA